MNCATALRYLKGPKWYSSNHHALGRCGYLVLKVVFAKKTLQTDKGGKVSHSYSLSLPIMNSWCDITILLQLILLCGHCKHHCCFLFVGAVIEPCFYKELEVMAIF